MFWFVILRQNLFWAYQTPPWWCCIMDKCLCFSALRTPLNQIKSLTLFAEMQTQTRKNTTTMLHCCLYTLILLSPCSTLLNNFLLLQPHISDLDSSDCPNVFMFNLIFYYFCIDNNTSEQYNDAKKPVHNAIYTAWPPKCQHRKKVTHCNILLDCILLWLHHTLTLPVFRLASAVSQDVS